MFHVLYGSVLPLTELFFLTSFLIFFPDFFIFILDGVLPEGTSENMSNKLCFCYKREKNIRDLPAEICLVGNLKHILHVRNYES